MIQGMTLVNMRIDSEPEDEIYNLSVDSNLQTGLETPMLPEPIFSIPVLAPPISIIPVEFDLPAGAPHPATAVPASQPPTTLDNWNLLNFENLLATPTVPVLSQTLPTCQNILSNENLLNLQNTQTTSSEPIVSYASLLTQPNYKTDIFQSNLQPHLFLASNFGLQPEDFSLATEMAEVEVPRPGAALPLVPQLPIPDLQSQNLLPPLPTLESQPLPALVPLNLAALEPQSQILPSVDPQNLPILEPAPVTEYQPVPALELETPALPVLPLAQPDPSLLDIKTEAQNLGPELPFWSHDELKEFSQQQGILAIELPAPKLKPETLKFLNEHTGRPAPKRKYNKTYEPEFTGSNYKKKPKLSQIPIEEAEQYFNTKLDQIEIGTEGRQKGRELKYYCGLCENKFTRADLQRRHIKTKHCAEQRMLKCELCEYRCHRTDHMDSHNLNKHGVRKL